METESQTHSISFDIEPLVVRQFVSKTGLKFGTENWTTIKDLDKAVQKREPNFCPEN